MKQRKLRVLVISMGGERQEHILSMFSESPQLASEFEVPQFSPGVPSRDLRSREKFFQYAHQAGIVPLEEWEAIQSGLVLQQRLEAEGLQKLQARQKHETNSSNKDIKKRRLNLAEKLFECLEDVPISNNPDFPRRGTPHDLKLHYSAELWYKAKAINRGRAVMACTLAHLIAMKRLVEEDFDIILEDNVRALDVHQTMNAAALVRQTIQASQEWEAQRHIDNNVDATTNATKCHMRMYGWLGPIANLRWIMERHAPKRKHPRSSGNNHDDNLVMPTVFPFPIIGHYNQDMQEMEQEGYFSNHQPEESSNTEDNRYSCIQKINDNGPAHQTSKPKGTPIWGAYSYWVSKQGYEAVLNTLRSDVGAMLWKNKRQRFYAVKPIDKIVPRLIRSVCGEGSVHVATHPSFFRAPMLTSKIHSQWDAEFCKSTEYQMSKCGGDAHDWSGLWLTKLERAIVHHREETGNWLTMTQLGQM